MKKIIASISLALLPFFIFSQTISSVSPATADAGQTLNVTITGVNTHFSSGSPTSVSFDFNQASSTISINSINVLSETSIQANITFPINTYTGNYNVNVNNSIDGTLSSNSSFHVTGGTIAPSLVSISPDSANLGQTLTVTITGTNTHFNSGSLTTISFNSTSSGATFGNVYTLYGLSANVIQFTITAPSYLSPGDYTVSLYNSIDGNLTLTNGFHVNGAPYIHNPSLVSISPDVIKASQTLNVTITGTNTHFSSASATSVLFNCIQVSGTSAISVGVIPNALNIINDTSIIANITVPVNTYCGCGATSISVNDNIDGTLSFSCSPEGISQIAGTGTMPTFIIYPNPFSSQTTLTLNKEVKDVIVRITDVTGKEIRTEHFSGTQLTIERGNLNGGFYFIQVIENNTIIATKKIVIQ